MVRKALHSPLPVQFPPQCRVSYTLIHQAPTGTVMVHTSVCFPIFQEFIYLFFLFFPDGLFLLFETSQDIQNLYKGTPTPFGRVMHAFFFFTLL